MPRPSAPSAPHSAPSVARGELAVGYLIAAAYGPLPDVITDVVGAQDAMRAHVGDIDVAVMLASTLHAIAVGNMLPAGVETYCVDINQAVVTKLADRGSHQALGIVTDVGLFIRDLAEHLTRG